MVFQCINIRQVPWEVLKTAAFGLGFQHLPRDLANVNEWKTMFDPYIRFYYWQFYGVNSQLITKTCLYNFDPLKPHFYIVKLGFTGYTLFFLFQLKT